MPRRSDISSILIIGAGPIIIGQACEFDYSGTQACKALKEEGYRIILINSNPATIMTDPEISDATEVASGGGDLVLTGNNFGSDARKITITIKRCLTYTKIF